MFNDFENATPPWFFARLGGLCLGKNFAKVYTMAKKISLPECIGQGDKTIRKSICLVISFLLPGAKVLLLNIGKYVFKCTAPGFIGSTTGSFAGYFL